MTGPVSDDDLVQRALSAVARAEPPAGLADRAFAAAMRAPRPTSFAQWLDEVLALSRMAAGAAAAVAAVLIVVAVAKASPASTTVAEASASATYGAADAETWVSAVLPFEVSQ